MTGLPQLLAWGRCSENAGGDNIQQPLGFQTKSGDGAVESTLESMPKERWLSGDGLLPWVRSRPRNPFQFLESRTRSKQGSLRPCGRIGLEERGQVLFTLGKPTETKERGREAGEKTLVLFATSGVGHHRGSYCSRPAPISHAVFLKPSPCIPVQHL